MKTLKQVTILAALIALTACGGWSQDPLKHAHSTMGPGQTKPTTDHGTITGSDFLKIEAPLFKLFKEGVEGEFSVTARVNASGDYTVVVTLKNLGSFDGATYDPATGKFTWTPAAGTATSEITEFPLDIEAVATAPGQPVFKTTYRVDVGVAKVVNASQPTISEVNQANSDIREGTTDYVTVKVDDPSVGSSTNPSDYPRLFLQNVSNTPSIASFVEIQSPTKLGNNSFEFAITVDLTNAEVTKDRTTYAASLIPMSHLNIQGSSQDITYSVLTSLSNLASTWPSQMTVKQGSKVDYTFLVIDPKGEGVVDVEDTSQIPAGSNMDCQPSGQSVLSCHFTWDVPVDAALGSLYVATSFVNKSPDSTDSYSVSTPLDLVFDVQAAKGSRK